MAAEYDIVQFHRQTASGSKTYVVRKRQSSTPQAASPTDEKLYLMEVVQSKGDASPNQAIPGPEDPSDYLPCPFASNLVAVLSSGSRRRYVMDNAVGGSLRNVLRRCKSAKSGQQEQALSDETVCLYAAELAIALSHLHSGGVTYGAKLSSDTVVVDGDSHVLLARTVHEQAYWVRRAPSEDTESKQPSPEEFHSARQQDWLRFAGIVCEMTGGKCDADGRADLSSLPTSSIRNFLHNIHQHCTSSDQVLGIAWVKEHALFKSLDFEKVTQKEVEPPELPCLDSPVTSPISPTSKASNNSPLAIRPRANTTAARIQKSPTKSSPTTSLRATFGAAWRSRSSSQSNDRTPSTDPAPSSTPPITKFRSPTSSQTSSPLSSRFRLTSHFKSSSPSHTSRTSFSPIRLSGKSNAGLASSSSPSSASPTISTRSSRSATPDIAATSTSPSPETVIDRGDHVDGGEVGVGPTKLSAVSPGNTPVSPSNTPVGGDILSIATTMVATASLPSPEIISPSLSPLRMSLMDDDEDGSLLDAVLSPMTKETSSSSIAPDSGVSPVPVEVPKHTPGPAGSTAFSRLGDLAKPYLAATPSQTTAISTGQQRPRSMSLITQPVLIKRQTVSESALPGIPILTSIGNGGEPILATSPGPASSKKDHSSPSLSRQTSKPLTSAMLQSHMDAAAHFIARSPVIQRRTSTPHIPSTFSNKNRDGGDAADSDIPKSVESSPEKPGTSQPSSRKPFLRLNLPPSDLPLSEVRKRIDVQSSSTASPRIMLTGSDDVTRTMESLDFFDLPPPVLPSSESPGDIIPADMGEDGSADERVFSPPPPVEFATPPCVRANAVAVEPPGQFVDSDGDMDVHPAKSVLRMVDTDGIDGKRSSCVEEAEHSISPSPSTVTSSPVSVGDISFSMTDVEDRRRTLSLPQAQPSSYSIPRSSSALSTSSGIGDGDMSWSNSTLSPTSNRHSYTSDESVELNWQWQERMKAITNRLDCMPESEEDLEEAADNTIKVERARAPSQTEGDSSGTESPYVFTRRLSRLRHSTARSSLRNPSDAAPAMTSTDDDFDVSGSYEDGQPDVFANSLTSSLPADAPADFGSSGGEGDPQSGRQDSGGDFQTLRRKAIKRRTLNNGGPGRSPSNRRKLSVIQSAAFDETGVVGSTSLAPLRPASTGCSSDIEGERTDGALNPQRISRSPRLPKRPISSTTVSPRASAELGDAPEVVMTERLCSECHKWQPMEFRGLEDVAVCPQCLSHRRKRVQALREIIDTESRYGHSLEVLQEVFMAPMQNGLVSQTDHAKIFLNVEELFEVHKRLLADMKSLLDDATDKQQADQHLHRVQIGNVILRHVEHFKAFHYYCVGSTQSVRLLIRLTKKSDLLRVFLRVCQMENDRCSKMGLHAFLLVPMQRITRYPLLLSKLLSHTSARHPDKALLQECMDKLGTLLDEINLATSDPSRVRRSASMQQTDSKPTVDIGRLTTFALQSLGWEEANSRVVHHGEVEVVQSKTESLTRGPRAGKRLLKKPTQYMYALLLCQKPEEQIAQVEPAAPESSDDDGDSCGGYGRVVHHYMLPSHYQEVRPHLVVITVSKENRLKCYKEPIALSECVVISVIEDDTLHRQFMISYPSTCSSQTFSVNSTDVREQWVTAFQSVTMASVPWKQRRRALANIMITTGIETYGKLV